MKAKKEVGKTHKQVGVFQGRNGYGLFLDNWPRIKKRKIVEKLFYQSRRELCLWIFEQRCWLLTFLPTVLQNNPFVFEGSSFCFTRELSSPSKFHIVLCLRVSFLKFLELFFSYHLFITDTIPQYSKEHHQCSIPHN